MCRLRIVKIVVITCSLTSSYVACSGEEWRFKEDEVPYIGEAISCEKDGTITLQNAAGATRKVAINKLNEKCRRKARQKFGLAIIDMTGYWRSDSNSFYEISDNVNGIFINLIDSHHIESLHAKFIRREKSKVFAAKNYTVVFKKHLEKRLEAKQVKMKLLPKDGDIEVSFNKGWAINTNGELVRLNGKSTWTRVSRDALPATKLPEIIILFPLNGG